MNRTVNIYEMGFLFFLLGLGAWAANWGTTPRHSASRTGTTFEQRFAEAQSRNRRGRQFHFQPGGEIRLAPRSLKPEEQYDYYAALCAQLGADPQRTTVLAMRGLGPDGRHHSSGDNMSPYDDTFVVLQPSVRAAREFRGATHAGQAVSSMSPAGGVAQIHPGVYAAEPIGDFNGMPAWWITRGWGDGQIPCFRDKNGDGFIGGKEREKTMMASEILVHNGISDEYGTSIGCQVLPPAAMRNFIATVGEGVPFDYVLVDANKPIGG